MRCTRLAANTGRKKSPSRHHRATLSGHIFATKAFIDNRKKLVNPRTGVGSKMTPVVTFKAGHYGEIEVTAMTFHENYSTAGRYIFLFAAQETLW